MHTSTAFGLSNQTKSADGQHSRSFHTRFGEDHIAYANVALCNGRLPNQDQRDLIFESGVDGAQVPQRDREFLANLLSIQRNEYLVVVTPAGLVALPRLRPLDLQRLQKLPVRRAHGRRKRCSARACRPRTQCRPPSVLMISCQTCHT